MISQKHCDLNFFFFDFIIFFADLKNILRLSLIGFRSSTFEIRLLVYQEKWFV